MVGGVRFVLAVTMWRPEGLTVSNSSKAPLQSAVEASRQAGASIAGVAMAHGINANNSTNGAHRFR